MTAKVVAITVGIMNSKANILQVIADPRFDLPQYKMPRPAESGKPAKPPVQGWRSLVRSELLSVARFWLFYPWLIAYLLWIGVHRLFAFFLRSAFLFRTVFLLSFAYLHPTSS